MDGFPKRVPDTASKNPRERGRSAYRRRVQEGPVSLRIPDHEEARELPNDFEPAHHLVSALCYCTTRAPRDQ